MHIPKTDPSMRIFSLVLPWSEFANQKQTKKEALNLNVYRNLYYRALSAMKNNFEARAKKLIQQKGIPPLGKVWLHSEIHPNQWGRVDTMNVGSIVDKFFSDSLTASKIIEDDDYTKVVFNSFCFGCVVKGEAFVKVYITELEPREEKRMRVLLDQEDIQAALEAYVEEHGISGATGVKLSAENGELTAEVLFGASHTELTDSDVENSTSVPTQKKRGGRPVGSKNKPKQEVSENAGTSGSGSTGSSVEGSGNSGGNTSSPFSDDEDDLFTKGGGKSKENPFEESQEESSQNDDSSGDTSSKETSTEGGVKKKASSIFDDED